VCWDQPCEVLLTACGHAVLCKQCFERLLSGDRALKCPLCNTAVPPVPGAWRLLESLNSLEPDTTFIPSAVDAAVADAAAALKSGDKAAMLRARVARGLAPQRALYAAAELGDEVLLRELVVEHGADPNMPDLARASPLGVAAFWGNVRCVRVLVELGADVARADEDGTTALHCAAVRGHTDCVLVLIEELGADVACMDVQDGRRGTALHRAAEQGQLDCMRALVDLGADVDCKNKLNRSALYQAAAKGNADCLRLLVELGANLASADTEGKTALHLAAGRGHLRR
jgi:ankyrin repeat protein